MKRGSIKVKITVWYLLFMIPMAALVLGFLVMITNSVAEKNAMNALQQTLRNNLVEVTMENDQLQMSEDFHFYQNGVYTLIYSKNEALMAGQIPVAFTATEPFQNGLTRLVDTQEGRYYVLDLWYPIGWENGLWMRGLMEEPERDGAVENLLLAAVIVLPVFIVFVAVGGYTIAKRAFRPLDEIIATAGDINEAADLAARMEVPKGNNEFSRLAGTFNQMFERLERSFEAEKQFTADASHELRTPVSIIKGACEYAEKYDETPEERAETIEMIHRQTLKMSALITQLLSMTRLDQGTEGAHMNPLELCSFVRAHCQEQQYDQNRLTLELGEPVYVRGDSALLGRLLQNLIENAFKYSAEDSHVWVNVQGDGTTARLAVRDNGIGIAADQMEKIWQRFYQVDAARSGGNGAGLGLAMVKKIAQAHGGEMCVDSVPQVGSQFTLCLPQIQPES